MGFCPQAALVWRGEKSLYVRCCACGDTKRGVSDGVVALSGQEKIGWVSG